VDSLGIAWRGELAGGILSHLDQIDHIEVLADDYFAAPRRETDALATLARQVPLYLHGVGMGLATCDVTPNRRIDAMARLCERVKPQGWSEHLAMVEVGGHVLGHLAPPLRTQANIDGTARNVDVAARRVGTRPALENIASLVEPPSLECSESEWITQILKASGAPLLLDLHNLLANATNSARDPLTELEELPLGKVTHVHLAGGCWVDAALKTVGTDFEQRPSPTSRWLDDHLHRLPTFVFELLEVVGARTDQSLTVTIEYDGHYPDFAQVLCEVDAARQALAAGRNARAHTHPIVSGNASSLAAGYFGYRPAAPPPEQMEVEWAAILASPEAARALTLRVANKALHALPSWLADVDPVAMEMAALSYARKRGIKTRLGQG
jgi:uncharacterized protein